VIQHIVLLKFRPGTDESQIDAAFGQAQSLVDEIDGVERISLGRNRVQADHGYTHALIVKLSDDDALGTYLHHPARDRYLREALGPIEQERIEIDVPEDLHVERHSAPDNSWHWDHPRVSASAEAAALRWDESHPEDA
jgi:hypothetical protein